MVILAKSLGGGFPTGAIGMTEQLAALVEDGNVHHMGTYNGNPLGMAAARANLLEVLTQEAYEHLERARRADGAGEGVGPGALARARLEGMVVHRSGADDPERAELIWTWLTNRGVLTTPGRERSGTSPSPTTRPRWTATWRCSGGWWPSSARRLSGSARA